MGDNIELQRQDRRVGPAEHHHAWERQRRVIRLTVALVLAVLALVVAVAVAMSSTAQAAPVTALTLPNLLR
jgi:flagellar basal body-associated protein FliL